VTPYKPSRKAKAFIKRIQLSWQSALKSIIEVGQILQTAKTDLDKKEWEDMINHELPFTRRTAEKLVKIASDPRILDPKNASILPPRWTTLEQITLLSNKQFQAAIRNGVIHADAERKDIEALVKPRKAKKKIQKPITPLVHPITASDQQNIDPAQLALKQTDQRRPSEDEQTDVVVAEISTNKEFTPKEATKLDDALSEFCQKHDLTVKLSGNLKKSALINDLDKDLRQAEVEFRDGERGNDLASINDAFYQFETGKNFPKNPDGSYKKNDLRNPGNEFYDFDKEQLYGYCFDLQIKTQYTPVEFLDETIFVKILMWRFLTGNELQKKEAYSSLEKLSAEEIKENERRRKNRRAPFTQETFCRNALNLLEE